MPTKVEFVTETCRGARVPWKDCNRSIMAPVPTKGVVNNNTGVRIRCRACGTTNFISAEDTQPSNDQREAI